MLRPDTEPSFIEDWATRLVQVERRELPALAWSFAIFFSVLCCYYILRPLRDEMGVTLDSDKRQQLFTYVFAVMLAMVPIFGWIVTNVARAWILPSIYLFLISNLIAFWLAWTSGLQGPVLASAFFVWVNIYVMFAVSLFWSFMSEVWESEQAKRLYGAISVGGTTGALTGPLLIQALLGTIGLPGLLLMCAGFLGFALFAALRLRMLLTGSGALQTPLEPSKQASPLAGALNVWKSPYLFKIALWVFIANVIGMFFYLEQARIVGDAIKDPIARVRLFSGIETGVSLLTIALQAGLANRLMHWIGVGRTTALLPIGATLGLIAFAIAPVLGTIIAIMVVQRAMGYGLANPAMRVLYTVVDSEDKYRAQNFVDTVVYRGGDAGAGWAFKVLGHGAGLGAASIALLALPLAALWFAVSLKLGGEHAERAQQRSAPKAAG